MMRTLFSARRSNRSFFTLLVFLVASLATMAAQTAPNPSLKVGDLFPDLAKYELEGQLPAALQGKIVIIDFWASWCSHCQRTFPIMEQLHYRYGRRGLVIIAVNEDRSRAAKDEFIKEHPVTFAVVRDAK